MIQYERTGAFDVVVLGPCILDRSVLLHWAVFFIYRKTFPLSNLYKTTIIKLKSGGENEQGIKLN